MCYVFSITRTATSGWSFAQLFGFNYKLTKNIHRCIQKSSDWIIHYRFQFSFYCTFYPQRLQEYHSNATNSHKKLRDLSLDFYVLCYYAAALVSLVRVLVIGNTLNQRIIRGQSLHKSNCVCTVCIHLLIIGKMKTKKIREVAQVI